MAGIIFAVLLCLVYALSRRLPAPLAGAVRYEVGFQTWFAWLYRASAWSLLCLSLAAAVAAVIGLEGFSPVDLIGISLMCAALAVCAHGLRDELKARFAPDGIYYGGRFVSWETVAEARQRGRGVEFRAANGKPVMFVGGIQLRPVDTHRIDTLLQASQ